MQRMVRMFAIDICLVDSSAWQEHGGKTELRLLAGRQLVLARNRFDTDHSYEIVANFAAARISRRLIEPVVVP